MKKNYLLFTFLDSPIFMRLCSSSEPLCPLLCMSHYTSNPWFAFSVLYFHLGILILSLFLFLGFKFLAHSSSWEPFFLGNGFQDFICAYIKFKEILSAWALSFSMSMEMCSNLIGLHFAFKPIKEPVKLLLLSLLFFYELLAIWLMWCECLCLVTLKLCDNHFFKVVIYLIKSAFYNYFFKTFLLLCF